MDDAIQLSIPVPRSLDTRIYLHLTVKARVITLFLTTASAEEKFNPDQPLSTPLLTVEPTLELTTRLAKLLAKKTKLPTYVGNSMSFASAGLGGTVEEELEALKNIVQVVTAKLQQLKVIQVPTTNGPKDS